MAYFGTTPDKKSHDHDVGEKTKSHPVRLAGAFWRVNEKLGLRKIAELTSTQILAPKNTPPPETRRCTQFASDPASGRDLLTII